MFKQVALLMMGLCFSLSLSCQDPSKKELKLYRQLYGIALDSFVEKKPSHFVLIDSSDNKAIKTINFSKYLNSSGLAKTFQMDSSWVDFLRMADLKKTTLQKTKLKDIKTIHTVRYFNRDTIFKIQRENHDVGKGIVNPYGWIDGVMTVSTPILSKNHDKAIVEISYTRDELDGNGGILLLEKRKNGSWVVIKYIRTWVA